MELTRDNFIQFVIDEKLIVDLDVTSTAKDMNFAVNSSQIAKKISLAFFEGKMSASPLFDNGKLPISTRPTGMPIQHERYKEVWIENLYRVDIYYIYEYFVTNYFLKTGEHNHLKVMKFFRHCEEINDDFTQMFRKFYHWFVARYNIYVTHTPECCDVFIKFKEIHTNDVIFSDGDEVFTFNPDIVVNFYEKECDTDIVKCKIRKVHGAYFDKYHHRYVMFEDGIIFDNISNKRKTFDPVVAMLTRFCKQ
jgi:hypothetical protein